MRYSENLHLNLPDDSDPLEVAKLSENFEALDEAVKETQKASGYQVGDTLTTWRTDLGDNWLLCNGDSFDPADYPDLAEVTPGLAAMIELMSLSALMDKSSFKYLTDGVHQVLFMLTAASTYGPAVSTDNFMTKPTTPYTISANAVTLFYTNNKWIMFEVSSGYLVKIHETEDVISSNWTVHTVSVGSFGNVLHAEFINGKYCVFAVSNNKPIVYRFSDFDLSDLYSYTPEMLPETLKKTGWNFVRTDNEFVYIVVSSGIHIVHTSNPVSTAWEETSIEYSRTFSGTFWYTNKKIVFFSVKSGSVDLPESGLFFEYIDLEYSLHTKLISKNTSNFSACYLLGESRRQFYFYSGKKIYVIAGLNETDPIIDLGLITQFTGTSDAIPQEKGIFWIYNGYLSFLLKNSSTYFVAYIPIYAVPKIDCPQSYTYIKAKEDTPNANQQTDTPAP